MFRSVSSVREGLPWISPYEHSCWLQRLSEAARENDVHAPITKVPLVLCPLTPVISSSLRCSSPRCSMSLRAARDEGAVEQLNIEIGFEAVNCRRPAEV